MDAHKRVDALRTLDWRVTCIMVGRKTESNNGQLHWLEKENTITLLMKI